ncbi:MAG: RuBisCO large subunit C-terminal-like domain-containing protein [Anaerolineae bacterium]|jgi:ribulose-bisphosphate carboxylase large chain
MPHSLGDAVLATYYIETEGDLRRVAEHMVELETTGAWQGAGEPTALFKECRGEVYEVNEVEPGKGTVSVLFPLINMNLEEAAYPSLWLTMVGGGTHALTTYEKSRLLDFRVPEQALRYFPGPQFGIEGTRELLGVRPGELIVGTIVKPTAGLTADEVADICYQAALGGVRFIKDDEKMLNVPYCPLAERVRKVSAALERAKDKTGLEVLYAPHITTNPDRLKENARIALANGANALMVNFFAAGFWSLEALARDTDFMVPIYAHCGGKEAFSRAPNQGVDANVVAKFARLLGGDYFRISTVGGYMVGGTREELLSLKNVMVEPLPGIKDMVPAISGGLKPENLPQNLGIFGMDVMVLAGTGITSHPMGISAGTKAMQQAAEAFRQGVGLHEYARTHEELRAALS